MSSPLRMRPVPLMPMLVASAWSSGSTIAVKPEPVARRRVRASALVRVPPFSPASVAVMWGASVISVTQDPSGKARRLRRPGNARTSAVEPCSCLPDLMF